jgi:excisionase family DNA binding protein
MSSSIQSTTPTPRSRRQAVEALSVSPRTAGEMLGFAKTKIAALVRDGELESFRDGGARRILTASIHAYIARKLESTGPASRGRHAT